MTAELGATRSRAFNRLAYDAANKLSALTAGIASADTFVVFDASADGAPKIVTPNDLTLGAALTRIVSTTATVLGLTLTQHGERIVLVNTNANSTNTLTLPVATGSGVKYVVRNNIAQTQGTVVVAANGTDIMKGKAVALDSTAAADAMVFLTTATSDKVSFNRTTTGGLGHDTVECYDTGANTWTVDVVFNGSGSLGTPFSET